MSFWRREKFNVRHFGSRQFRLRIAKTRAPKRSFGTAHRRRFTRAFAFLKRARVWKMSLIAACLLAFYFLFVSKAMLITDVAFAGNDKVKSEQLTEVFNKQTAGRTFFIKKNHYLFMTEGRLNKLFTSAVNEIKRVSANRKWPARIEIEITERNPGFVYKTAGKIFLIDDEGMAISETVPAGLPEVTNLNNDEIKIGEALANPKLTAFILSMSHSWPSKIAVALSGIKISKIGSNDIQFDSQESWSVFFDINRSVISQLNNLALILNRQIPAADRPNLAYIDLRSDKWVYYCFKNTPCSQTEIPKENNEQ